MPIANPTNALLKNVAEDNINGMEVRITDDTGVVLPTKSRVILVASSAQTASGNSGAIQPQGFKELLLFLRLTAVAGTTPPLNVYLRSSDHGCTTWFQLAQLGPSNIAAAPANNPYPSTYTLSFNSAQNGSTGWGDTIRLRWVIAGTTPSYTFQVTAVYKQ